MLYDDLEELLWAVHHESLPLLEDERRQRESAPDAARQPDPVVAMARRIERRVTTLERSR